MSTIAEIESAFQSIPMEAIQRFAEAFGKIVDALKPLSAKFEYSLYYSRFDLQPALRYRLAGHPYGKHVRGKKRWLREMKAVSQEQVHYEPYHEPL